MIPRSWSFSIAAAGLAATLALTAPAAAQETPEATGQESPDGTETPPTPEEIDQRLRILERRLELDKEQAAEKAKAAAVATAGKDGFAIKSASGDFQLKLRGYVQVDSRFFLDDDEQRASDTTLLRRARPIVEGTLYRIFDFRLMPDFGGGTAVLQDGYLEARFTPALRVRAGKFKPPIGLERLQAATDIGFVERALPTALVPNRDLGIQLSGDLAGGKLGYALGVFNGVPDGGSADSDSADGKELAGRLFWRPFQTADGAPAEVDLGIGLAASSGDEQGTATAPALPAFRSAGQQSFFSYRADGTLPGTAIADGGHTRLSPQGWLYAGPWGVLAEAVRSEQEISRGSTTTELAHSSWQVAVSWVATGERNSYRAVAPRRDFDLDPDKGGFGAVILSARVNALEVDRDAFPVLADPARAAREAFAWGAGVAWNLNRNVRLLLDYERTEFEGGAAAGADRATEQVVFSRFQIAF